MGITTLESLAAGGDAVAFVIRTDVSGVMYSDHFTVYEAWVCLPAAVPGSSTLHSHLRITMLKPTSLQSVIENQAKKDLKEARVLWRQLAGPHIVRCAETCG